MGAVFHKVNLGNLEHKVPSVFLPNNIPYIADIIIAPLNVARFRSQV